jgi:hypothetical protein
MPMPTIVGVGAAAASTGTVVAPYPAAYTATLNDVGIILVECEGAGTPTAPSGWGIIATSTVATGTTTKLTAMWRRIQGGDTAPTVPDAGDHTYVRMIVIGGCVTSGNPWNIFAATQENVADLTVSIPGVTTTVANCLILAAVGTGQDVTTTAGVTSWANASLAAPSIAEQMDCWQSAQGLGGGMALATGGKATAGVVSATTATMVSPLVSNFKAHLVIALAGEAAAAGPPSLVMAPRIR